LNVGIIMIRGCQEEFHVRGQVEATGREDPILFSGPNAAAAGTDAQFLFQ
jgi:hypothetical protein